MSFVPNDGAVLVFGPQEYYAGYQLSTRKSKLLKIIPALKPNGSQTNNFGQNGDLHFAVCIINQTQPKARQSWTQVAKYAANRDLEQ